MRFPASLGRVRRRRRSSGVSDETVGTPLFDWPFYIAITEARLEHLEHLDLPIRGRSVVDLGCGIGRLSEFFVERGCEVVCVDGRADNIAELRRSYPERRAEVIDVETDELGALGVFDVVFCYGLLYHLADPFAFLRRVAPMARELLILETCVSDSEAPITALVRDPDDPTMALHSLASRPSPGYVAAALTAAGLEHVYTPLTRPEHPDFAYSRLDDGAYFRDGHALREVFVATREPLEHAQLVPLAPQVPSGH